MTKTQQRIMTEVRDDPNQMTIFIFHLREDGSISDRRDLEAIEELLGRGDLIQVNRVYELCEGGWRMAVMVSEPKEHHVVQAALARMADHIVWDLPAHHKGFFCQYGHDQIVRAAERAIEKTLAGERAKRCQCRYCVRQRKEQECPSNSPRMLIEPSAPSVPAIMSCGSAGDRPANATVPAFGRRRTR